MRVGRKAGRPYTLVSVCWRIITAFPTHRQGSYTFNSFRIRSSLRFLLFLQKGSDKFTDRGANEGPDTDSDKDASEGPDNGSNECANEGTDKGSSTPHPIRTHPVTRTPVQV